MSNRSLKRKRFRSWHCRPWNENEEDAEIGEADGRLIKESKQRSSILQSQQLWTRMEGEGREGASNGPINDGTVVDQV